MIAMPAAGRVFFALWPDAATRASCTKLATQFSEFGGRLVSPGNLHITLSFLGAVSAAQRACAECAADGVHAQAVTLTLDRLGYFAKP